MKSVSILFLFTLHSPVGPAALCFCFEEWNSLGDLTWYLTLLLFLLFFSKAIVLTDCFVISVILDPGFDIGERLCTPC